MFSLFVNIYLAGFALLGPQKLDNRTLFKSGALRMISEYFESPQNKYFYNIKTIFA